MRGLSETLIALILMIIGLALAIFFVLIYLHGGGTIMNNTSSAIPNTTPLFGG